MIRQVRRYARRAQLHLFMADLQTIPALKSYHEMEARNLIILVNGIGATLDRPS